MKKLTVLIATCLTMLAFNSISNALYIDPELGTFAPGSSTTITMYADPPATDDVDGMQIRITLVGGTITNVAPSSSGYLAIGTCDAQGATFTTTKVCFDLTKTGQLFAVDDVIGTFTVTWGSAGTATVTKDADNAYIDNTAGTSTLDPGQAGSFTINAVAPTATFTPVVIASATPTPVTGLPETGIADGIFPIFLGLMVIGTGIVVYNYSQNAYSTVQTQD